MPLNASALLNRPVCVEVPFDVPDPAAPGLTCAQLVERIVQLNPSATPDFLSRFNHQALEDYFEHLQLTTSPRGRDSLWVRRPGSAAVTVRAARV